MIYISNVVFGYPWSLFSTVPWTYDPILIASAAFAPWILTAIYDNVLVLLNKYMLPQVFAYHHSLPHRDGNPLHLDPIEQLFSKSTYVRWNTWRCWTITMTSWHRKFTLTSPMMTTSPPSPSIRSSIPQLRLSTLCPRAVWTCRWHLLEAMVFTYSSFPTDSYNSHDTRQTRTQPHANQHSRCFAIHVSSMANAPTTSITTSSGQSCPSQRTSWTFWRHGLRPEHHVRTDCTISQFGQFPGQYLSLTKIALPILLTNFHVMCWLSYISRILSMSYPDAWFLLLFGFHSAFSVHFDSVGFWPPQPWQLRLKKKMTLCQTDTSLEKLEPYLMKKLFIPLNSENHLPADRSTSWAMDRGNQSSRSQTLAHLGTISWWLRHQPIGGSSRLRHGQLCSPWNSCPSMAWILQCSSSLFLWRPTPTPRTSMSRSTSTNRP